MASKFGPMHQRLTLVVDLDERGSFRAHVENTSGRRVFQFSNEDENGWPDPDGIELVRDGFMKHGRDTQGLLSYLQDLGIARPGATLACQG